MKIFQDSTGDTMVKEEAVTEAATEAVSQLQLEQSKEFDPLEQSQAQVRHDCHNVDRYMLQLWLYCIAFQCNTTQFSIFLIMFPRSRRLLRSLASSPDSPLRLASSTRPATSRSLRPRALRVASVSQQEVQPSPRLVLRPPVILLQDLGRPTLARTWATLRQDLQPLTRSQE